MTKSYMEKLTFTTACLSNVRVILVIMRVPSVELLCQAVMGRIPTLEYLLPSMRGACGHALLCQMVNPLLPKTQAPGKKSTQFWKILGGMTGCPRPSRVREGGASSRQVVKSCLPMSSVMRKR
jgi:hypothetical protein